MGLKLVAGAALIGAAVWTIGRFLAFTFSDVFIWNSRNARDRDYGRREEVLRRTQALVEHVVGDPNCKRLVIVAHSLGTAIALETLNRIGRRNVARAGTDKIVPMRKLSHLFTLGSPIDKIFYFFQTDEAKHYRAGRLNDDLRGDLSQEPFFRDDRQRVEWINIWDPADPVSDPLFSPLGNLTEGARIRTATIRNCRVENTRWFSPTRNHVAYLDNVHVVESIAEALFRNGVSVPEAPLEGIYAYRDAEAGKTLLGFIRVLPLLLLVGSLFALGQLWLHSLAVVAVPAVGFLFRGLTTPWMRARFREAAKPAIQKIWSSVTLLRVTGT